MENPFVTSSTEPSTVPPLRLRYRASDRGGGPQEIVDIAWSPDDDESDPPSIAFLNQGVIHPAAKSTWDVEDPTNPDNDLYPPDEAAELPGGALVRCAASHWQRVHPRMRRFTQTELEAAAMLGALGSVESALDMLIEFRPVCEYVREPHPAYPH